MAAAPAVAVITWAATVNGWPVYAARNTRAKNDSKLVVKLTKTDYLVSQLLSFPGFWRYSLS
jgi:hypothetical protein